jgi:hypothetical protein
MAWYQDNPTGYGNLWDPTAGDGTKEDILVPRLIALTLRAAKISPTGWGSDTPQAPGLVGDSLGKP